MQAWHNIEVCAYTCMDDNYKCLVELYEISILSDMTFNVI